MAYLFLFGLWVVSLWCLSAGNPAPQNAPEIPHLDKVVHFTYFFIGGVLLTTSVLVAWPFWKERGIGLFIAVLLICSLIGRLDEYHQGFTPGRSGNDMGDWLADSLGGAAGAAMVIWLILPQIRRFDGQGNHE